MKSPFDTILRTTGQQPRFGAAFYVGLACLPVLLWYGNPAVALLTGAALSIGFNQGVMPATSTLGKYALQTAIVLLGLKLNASQLFAISAQYSFPVTVYVIATLIAGFAIGRLVGTEHKSSALITTGTAICGGTTISSLSPVISARAEQTGVALSLVFLLNAVALFSFPAIGHWLGLSQEQFGVWAALAIHDTSSVVATAALYGEEAAKVATTVKLGRTLWLIPLLLVASILAQRGSVRLRLPVFVLAFVAAACLGSLVSLPAIIVSGASIVSKWLLTMALFFIGTDISRKTLKAVRGSVLVQGIMLWLIVVPVTLWAIVRL